MQAGIKSTVDEARTLEKGALLEFKDKLRKVDAQNPYNHLSQYAALLNGAPKNQVTSQSMSPLQAGLGLGIGGLGLLGGLGWLGGGATGGGTAPSPGGFAV